jgi:N-acetylmuramoyl-L-alanine amidase
MSKHKYYFFLSSFFFFFLFCQKTLAGSLDYWRFNVQQNRLDIVTEDNVRPRVKLIGDPTRLVVDLPSVTIGKPRSEEELTDYVKEVRIGQFDRSTTRIVVELEDDYTVDPKKIKVRGLAPNRWYIQLPSFIEEGDIDELPENGVAIATPLPTPYPKSRIVVVVDPGHGGRDVGAVGLNGLYEKNVILPIGLELAEILKRQGMQVVLTRSKDVFIDLAPRVAIANRAKARAFVSVHANSAGDNSSVNGLETYYYNSNSLKLAQTVHRNILQRISVRDRGVKRARFYVIRNTTMPAILVEVGFVTGSQDGRNLGSSSYRRKMAEAIAQGVIQYFK